MKVLFFLGGNELKASTRIRVLQFLPFLKKDKIEYKLIFPRNNKSFKPLRILKDYIELRQAKNFDVVFIQKRKFPIRQFEYLKKLNPNIIYDFDDAIFAIKKENVEKWNVHSENLRNFSHTLKIAKTIIVSNDYLAKYVGKYESNTKIIPSSVDVSKYTQKKYEVNEKILLGYVCNPENLAYLKDIAPALKKVCEKHENVCLKIISSKSINLPGVRTTFQKFNVEKYISDLRSFDIGLMPYPDQDWVRGKAGFKGIECMAVGVPVVASPMGIIPEIITNEKNGFLAKNNDKWEKYLELLIANPELREKMGILARNKIVKKYSIQENYKKFKEALFSKT